MAGMRTLVGLRLLPGRLVGRIRPNRVRHPTDWSTTSDCSPRRLAAAQLSSVSGRRAYAWRGLAPLWMCALGGAPGRPVQQADLALLDRIAMRSAGRVASGWPAD